MAGGAFGSLMAVLTASIHFYLDLTGEILVNPGFEQPLGSGWTCIGCTGRLVNDSHYGNSSYLATNRYQSWHGPQQTITNETGISTDRIYRFSGYVKILPSIHTEEKQIVHASMYYIMPDGTAEWRYIFHNHNVEPADGWVLMEAEFYILNIDQAELSFVIRDVDAGVDFLVDSLSIVDIGYTLPELESEVLSNAGFENPIGGSGWYCVGSCAEVLVNDSHTGNQAYKAFNRTESSSGPRQTLWPSSGISPGHIYQFSGYIKILPSIPDQELQFAQASLLYQRRDYSWDEIAIAHVNDVGPEDGWVKMEAEIYILDENQRKQDFVIRYVDAGIDFLLDSLSITEVGEALPEPSGQILRNGGFENPIGGSGWFCYGLCSQTRVNDSHTGSKAYKAFDRTSSVDGPIQNILIGSRISAGKGYSLSGYTKVLPSLATLRPQSVRAVFVHKTASNSLTDNGIGYVFNIEPADGWVQIVGDFYVPDDAVDSVYLAFDGPDPGVDFLVDSVSITENDQVSN